jgi:hypothetical protein
MPKVYTVDRLMTRLIESGRSPVGASQLGRWVARARRESRGPDFHRSGVVVHKNGHVVVAMGDDWCGVIHQMGPSRWWSRVAFYFAGRRVRSTEVLEDVRDITR